MNLSFPDTVAALEQLITTTASEYHHAALLAALNAVKFKNTLSAAFERHHAEHPPVLVGRGLGAAGWSAEEDSQLRIEFESGMTLDEIGVRHGRTPLEVAERLYNPLGILSGSAVDEIRTARSRMAPRPAAVVAVPEAIAPVAVAAPVHVPAPVVPEVIVAPPAPEPAPVPVPVVPVAPVVATAPVAVAPAPAPTPAPAAETHAVNLPAVALAAAIATASFAGIVPEASAAEMVAPAHEASVDVAARPELTADEDKAVNSVLTKYTAKGAPQATLRMYIESERFSAKLRPEILSWLRAELIRLS